MLNGKTAVVTGGTRGIGKAIAYKLAGNGANIAVIATRETDAAKKVIDEFASMGVKARLYTCDIKNADEVASTSEEILADFGQVDILRVEFYSNYDNNNITFRANGKDGRMYTVSFPKTGEAPMMIAVDPSTNWMTERTSIPSSWFTKGV